MILQKTNIQVDLAGLRKSYLENINNWPIHKNRIAINNHDGVDEYVKNNGQRMIYTEFKYTNTAFKNTVWEETLNLIPGKLGRARIMLMPYEKMLPTHRDIEARWHVALFTDPACVFYDNETCTGHHIPSDGYLYRLDARRLHTVFNGTTNVQRVHLVVCEYV